MGKMYVIGGYTGGFNRDNTIELYDIKSNIWNILGIRLPNPIEASLLINLTENNSSIVFF